MHIQTIIRAIRAAIRETRAERTITRLHQATGLHFIPLYDNLGHWGIATHQAARDAADLYADEPLDLLHFMIAATNKALVEHVDGHPWISEVMARNADMGVFPECATE